jgi:radical SAM superfamily enzyme YgiQ (UPF0313 family)
MDILLIIPYGRIHRLTWPFKISFREAPLTLTTLAALVPDDLDASVVIADENVDSIPYERHFDLVGISCVTGTALRAYHLADVFRGRGSTVVMGGVHVTIRPEEAAQHADCVVTGPAERSWPRVLRDFYSHNLQKRYDDRYDPSLPGLPFAARHLQKRFGYMTPNTVFATRGCRGTCDFCTVPAAGVTWQTRPVNEVIDEVRSLKGRRFVFNDVSLIEDRDYAKELFSALIPLGKIWGALCTARIGRDDELLDLMQQSGCIYLLIGFESVSGNALYDMRKRHNNPERYDVLVDKLHDKGITVQGCFIFGFDHDTPDVFDATVDAVNRLKIDIPRYSIYTPYPGTTLFRRLKQEDRILHENWYYYDTQHVVYRPRNMTPEQLDKGFISAYRKTFRTRSVVRRSCEALLHRPVITFMGNVAYNIYRYRLRHDGDRLFCPPPAAETAAAP